MADDTHRLREAARRFFPGWPTVSFVDGSSGFSGSALARVKAERRSWCLRRWPAGFKERRLRFVHRVLLESRANGFTGVPELAKTGDGDTVVALAGRLYDAQEWLAGEPLSRDGADGGPTPNVAVSLAPARISCLAAALARLHRSTARLPFDRDNGLEPLSARLDRLAGDAEARHDTLLSGVRVRADGGERSVALRWLELLPGAIAAARGISPKLPEASPDDLVVCHGDLWPAHVHFNGDTFVGFTDFESLRFATPALDLAQLVLHFGGWEMRQEVLRCYEAAAPLVERARAALPLEAVTDLAGEGYWSLVALYGDGPERTTPAQRAEHGLNLRGLIGCLEKVVEELWEIRS